MPTSEIYDRMTTADLLALRQGNYDGISTEGLQLLKPKPSVKGRTAEGHDYDLSVGGGDVTSPDPFLDPIDFIPGGLGAKAGAKAGSRLLEGPLRALARWRLGSNPGQGFEKVAETVGRVAPSPLRPAEASAEGLVDVMRGGAGRAALKESREQGLKPLSRALEADTQANRAAAGKGLTGGYQARAAEAAADPAGRFKQLTQELADAGRGGYNRATGEARTGAGSLAPLRDKAAILDEIKGLLSPGQWRAFQALQKEYAEGSSLLRLFKPGKGAGDVLTDQAALQSRAKGMQESINPDLLKSIFRGGKPLQTDKAASIPLGLSKFGRLSLPGTVMAGPADPWQQLLMTLFSGGASGASGVGLSRALQGLRRTGSLSDAETAELMGQPIRR